MTQDKNTLQNIIIAIKVYCGDKLDLISKSECEERDEIEKMTDNAARMICQDILKIIKEAE